MTQQDEPRYVQEEEGDLGALESKHVVIIGYGNLGRPFALNLRDSGVTPITVAELPGPAWEQALADGFTVNAVEAAAAEGTVVVGSTPLQARMPMAIKDRPANKRSFPTLPILQSRNLTAVELPHAVPERGAPRLMPPGIGLGPPIV